MSRDVVGLGLRELVGTDDRAGRRQERAAPLLLADRVVAFGFEDQPLQAELVLQLLVPLLAQVRRHDDEQLAPPFGPALRDDQTGLDGLAQTDLVGQDHAARKGIAAGEQRRLDLMRIQVHLRIDQGRSQRLHRVARRASGQQPGVILALVRRQKRLCRQRQSSPCSYQSVIRRLARSALTRPPALSC